MWTIDEGASGRGFPVNARFADVANDHAFGRMFFDPHVRTMLDCVRPRPIFRLIVDHYRANELGQVQHDVATTSRDNYPLPIRGRYVPAIAPLADGHARNAYFKA
jgi:hypothetical protein